MASAVWGGRGTKVRDGARQAGSGRGFGGRGSDGTRHAGTGA